MQGQEGCARRFREQKDGSCPWSVVSKDVEEMKLEREQEPDPEEP